MKAKNLCHNCNLDCKTKKNLDSHKETCTDRLTVTCKNLTCKNCGKNYSNKYIKRHERNCVKPKKKYTCNKCKANCSSEDYLYKHSKKCVGQKNRLACDFCSKLYAKNALKQHENICPENENRIRVWYTCDKCKLNFKRKDNLAIHKNKCIGDKPLKLLSCTYKGCTEFFANKLSLLEHLRNVHGKEEAGKKHQNLYFNNFDEFQKWKDEEEESTFSYFTRRSGSSFNGKYYFYCQHDRQKKPHRGKGEPAEKTCRQRSLGPISARKSCMAMMQLKINADGTCHTKYFSTHSHILKMVDWTRQPQKKRIYEEIDRQIALHIPPSDIVNNIIELENVAGGIDDVKKTYLLTENLVRLRAKKIYSMLEEKIYRETLTAFIQALMNKEKDDNIEYNNNRKINPSESSNNLDEEGGTKDFQFLSYTPNKSILEISQSKSKDKSLQKKPSKVSLINFDQTQSVLSFGLPKMCNVTNKLLKKSERNVLNQESLDNVTSKNLRNEKRTEANSQTRSSDRNLKRKNNNTSFISPPDKKIPKNQVNRPKRIPKIKKSVQFVCKSPKEQLNKSASNSRPVIKIKKKVLPKINRNKDLIQDFQRSTVREGNNNE